MEWTLFPIQFAANYPRSYFEEAFPQRLARAERCRQEGDRLRLLSGGILLKEVLGLTEQNLSYHANGKPFAEKRDIFFSLSHSGDYALLVASGAPIGADIEQTGRTLSKPEAVLTRRELEYLQKTDRPNAFLHLWTLKESFGKALGCGLLYDCRHTDLLPLLRGEAVSYDGADYYALTREFNGYVLSACTQGKALTPELHIFGESKIITKF